jgi:hypothetical protein
MKGISNPARFQEHASLRLVSRTTSGASWTRCGTSARPSPRQAAEVRRSQDLMSAARGVLGHAGIELVLVLLKAGRIPTRTRRGSRSAEGTS